MKLTALMILLLGAQIAQAENLVCDIKVNGEAKLSQRVSAPESSHQKFAEFDGYTCYLNNHGKAQFELEVFDGSAETRSYSDGALRTADDRLGWSLWSRDVLIETSCRLSNEKVS